MNTAAAWLIIVTSAWSGDGSRGVEMPSMEACRASLAEMKIMNPTGATIAAFCSPTKPNWWR